VAGWGDGSVCCCVLLGWLPPKNLRRISIDLQPTATAACLEEGGLRHRRHHQGMGAPHGPLNELMQLRRGSSPSLKTRVARLLCVCAVVGSYVARVALIITGLSIAACVITAVAG